MLHSRQRRPPRRQRLPLVAERLSDRLAARLGGQIDAGALRPGDRLPTEQRLAEAHGVSRTVVREAVHQLKSRGLVRSRQGSGVYVARRRRARRSPLDPAVIDSVDDVLRVRRGAARARGRDRGARRRARQPQPRSPRCARALQAIDRSAAEARDGVAEDLAFHRAARRGGRQSAVRPPARVSRAVHCEEAMRVTRRNDATPRRLRRGGAHRARAPSSTRSPPATRRCRAPPRRSSTCAAATARMRTARTPIAVAPSKRSTRR